MTQARDRTHPRRPPSSLRGEDTRESTILRDGVKRVSTSITRFEKNGRNYPERTDFNYGNNWRVSGLSMLMRPDVAREDARSTRQTWKRKMLVPFQTCQDCRLRWSSLEMMIISLTAHGRILLMKEEMTILISGMKLILMGKA